MPEMEPNIGLRLEYTCYSVRHQGKQWQKCHEQPCFYNPALFPPRLQQFKTESPAISKRNGEKLHEKWSGRLDSNQRPLRPERSAPTRLSYAPTSSS